jgi:peptidoglycan/xylan/chitin deacetylase (PgdA/CDA1 family)
VIISAGLVLAIGPAYIQSSKGSYKSLMMLSFSVKDGANVPGWCTALSSLLGKYNASATVFVTGMVADKYPQCVSTFVSLSNIDIGSQTYSYANLTSISDYTQALKEVKDGKQAVDKAANINSAVFKAPYGSTNSDIYSMLTRSNISADFSYESHYNKYENRQFVKYDLNSYNGSTYTSESVRNLASSSKVPVLISFDNSIPIEKIDRFVSDLTSDSKVKLVNASDLTQLNLTVKGE